MKVERDRDRQLRCHYPDAAQELALRIVDALRHHRAVKVEQHGVASASDVLENPVADPRERVIRYRSAG